MAVSICPGTAGTVCDGAMPHLDLAGEETYKALSNLGNILLNVSFRMVACDVQGPVKVLVPSGFNYWSISFLVFNHRVGLARVEFSQDAGATWVNMTRSGDNRWKLGGNGKSAPIVLRITSILGDQVYADVPVVTGSETVVQARSQFPEPKPIGSETCCSRPDVFTKVYDEGVRGTWGDCSPAGKSTRDPKSTEGPHSGQYCMKVTGTDWGGVDLGTVLHVPRNQFSGAEFWVKTPGACSNCVLSRVYWTGGYGDTMLSTDAANQWKHCSVSFDTLKVGPTGVSDFVFAVVGAGPGTFYLDDIKLIKSPNATSTAVCADGTLPGNASSHASSTVESCECGTSGVCCDGCHFRPSTTVCRSSEGSCDPEEKCTGSSEACPADVSLCKKPVALSLMDEGTGTAVADSSPNGLSGSLSSVSLRTWVSGVSSKALRFSSNAGVMVVRDPSRILSAVGNYSVSMWIKFSSLTSEEVILSDGVHKLYHWGSSRPSGNGLHWLVKTAEAGAAGGDSSWNGSAGVLTVTRFRTSRWYHVVVVIAGQNMMVFVNGRLDRTVPALAGSSMSATDAVDMKIGNFSGTLDEVTFHGEVLPQAEIVSAFQKYSGRTEQDEFDSQTSSATSAPLLFSFAMLAMLHLALTC